MLLGARAKTRKNDAKKEQLTLLFEVLRTTNLGYKGAEIR